MSDTTLTDLGPFFKHHDRRNLWLLAAAPCTSLALSALIATRLLAAGAPGPQSGSPMWGTGVVFTPLFITAWCAFGWLMVRRRRKAAQLHGGTLAAGALDAANAMRIANAGFVYFHTVTGAMLWAQVLMALVTLGLGHWIRGDLVARGIMLAVGATAIYFGNVFPRMPVPRVPEHKVAQRMKTNRYGGWFMVIVGLMIALWGLFNPYMSPPGMPTQHPYVPPPFVASRHREITLPPAELDKFVGHYDFGNGFEISVTHDGPTLWVLRERSPGARAAPIYPEAPRAFFWKAVEAQIRFTTNADGAVTGAEFREDGAWQPGKRLTPQISRPKSPI